MAIMVVKQKKQTIGFKGNLSLRNISEQIELTDWQIEELKKCRADFEYFIDNYVYIINLDKGECLFKLYKYQRKVLRHFHKNRNTILMTSRQQGKTQTTAAYLTWFSIFHSSKNICIVANKAAGAKQVLSRVKYSIERLPKWMQSPIKTWNVGTIELFNESRIFTAATTRSGPRGNSADLIYWDEAGWVESNEVASEFYSSILPMLSSGKKTKMIVTSTPRGYNFFWSLWDGAEKGNNGFVPMQIHYSAHPERQKEWADTQLKLLGQLRYNQEVLCTFQGSSLTLLNGDSLTNLAKAMKSPIYQDETGSLAVFKEPDLGTKNTETNTWELSPHSYFAVVDVSRGVGGDSSTCMMIDTTELPYRLVARYKSNEISPLLFPSVIHKLATEYNNAFVLVEINDNGQQIADILHDELEYDNILCVVKDGTRGQSLSSGFGRLTANQLGVRTTKQVKSIGCGSIKTLIEESNLIIEDDATIKEFSTFIETRGSYAADIGYHDDCVMPLVLFGWMTTQTFFKDLTNLSVRERIFQARIDNIQQRFTPFMFKTDGREEETKSVANEYNVSSLDHSMSLNSSYERFSQLSSDEIEDLRWLLS